MTPGEKEASLYSTRFVFRRLSYGAAVIGAALLGYLLVGGDDGAPPLNIPSTGPLTIALAGDVLIAREPVGHPGDIGGQQQEQVRRRVVHSLPEELATHGGA